MIGKIISHYKILEKIGAGGMGVVYRAKDTKLDRTVALKFLPPHLSIDKEDKKRFIHEAKAAASLDHPNICAVYEIDETPDSQMFIAMAYYKGKTLKDKISSGPLPLEEAINIAIQVAEGLNKAHKKNIIHRDIKAANIMMTDDNVAKIVDFGLAKLKGQTKLTKEGTTLGTIEYMSPEQASGEKVDHRTDIWSLGVLLYEMVTGQLPFTGEYDQAVMYAIMNGEPEPVTGIRTGIPMELERIINKILAKDPEERYQGTADLGVDLKKVKKDSKPELTSAKKIEKVIPAPGRNKIPKRWFIIGFTILMVATLLIIFSLQKPKPASLQVTGRVISLTAFPGLEDKPTWSPDGKHIAYMSDKNGNFDIYVMNVDTGQALNLTKDYIGDDTNPAWSPDGNRIAFYSDRGGGGIYHLSNMGGAPILVINIADIPEIKFYLNISWSPDGSNLVYTYWRLLSIISVKSGKPKEIPLPTSTRSRAWLSGSAWSPDGKRIAFTEPHDFIKLKSTIWTLNPDGSNPIKITDGNSFSNNPVWSSDGRKLFFISNMGGGSNDIWWVPIEAGGKPFGSAKCLMPGVNVSSIALSGDGTRLVFSKVVRRSNIWSIPIVDNHTFTLEEAEQVTFENHSITSLDLSPDGKWIAFSSNRKGNADIWIMNKKTKELRQLTTSKASDTRPDWSPDGKHIVFSSDRNGNNDIFRKPVAGGITLQLTSHQKLDTSSKWSPKGDEIAFTSTRTGTSRIYVIPSSGGDPRMLTMERSGNHSVWSPNGSKIAFRSPGPTGEEVFYISSKGGKPVQLTNLVGVGRAIIPYHWSSVSKYIYAWGNKDWSNSYGLWNVSFPDGSTKPLLSGIGGNKQLSYTLSSDGARIYFVVREYIGDLSMAELAEVK